MTSSAFFHEIMKCRGNCTHKFESFFRIKMITILVEQFSGLRSTNRGGALWAPSQYMKKPFRCCGSQVFHSNKVTCWNRPYDKVGHGCTCTTDCELQHRCLCRKWTEQVISSQLLPVLTTLLVSNTGFLVRRI